MKRGRRLTDPAVLQPTPPFLKEIPGASKVQGAGCGVQAKVRDIAPRLAHALLYQPGEHYEIGRN